MSKLFASCTVRVLPPRDRGDKRLVADGAAVYEVMVASHGPADYLRCVDRKQRARTRATGGAGNGAVTSPNRGRWRVGVTGRE